jgi:3-hydroxybutyryl-CoA dehydrogenase
MGSDVAVVLARSGAAVTLVDRDAERTHAAAVRVSGLLSPERTAGALLRTAAELADVAWADVDLVVENVPELLAVKQQVFSELDRLAPPQALLASNSSSIPISEIGRGLSGTRRMFGLHFFMPAHLVPLVEVVMGPESDAQAAHQLMIWMRGCGSVPVLVKKDLPGFLANRLQHALSREAFALIDAGVASPEDVDAAVRYGFGFRFLAAGPVLQRDHGGMDVHSAAAATIYPSLSNTAVPSRTLLEHVAAGRLGLKVGRGFYDWPEPQCQSERERYARMLRLGLALLASELPPTTAAPSTPGIST